MPNVPLHLLPPVVVQVFPPMVTGAFTSPLSKPGSGPAACGIAKQLSPPEFETEMYLPMLASYVSSSSAPSTEAQTCVWSGDTPPKSTCALTPIEHEAPSTLKYGSGQFPLKSLTSRAIGGFGGAPEPPVE